MEVMAIGISTRETVILTKKLTKCIAIVLNAIRSITFVITHIQYHNTLRNTKMRFCILFIHAALYLSLVSLTRLDTYNRLT